MLTSFPRFAGIRRPAFSRRVFACGFWVTGLPDLEPLQETLLKEVQERLSANIKAMDPKAMLETWLPATLKGFEQLQEAFLSRMAGGGKKK